jgi:hypothetical protein
MTCFNVNSVKYNRKMHEIEANSGEGLETIGPLAKDSPCENDPVTKITVFFIEVKKLLNFFLFARSMLMLKRNSIVSTAIVLLLALHRLDARLPNCTFSRTRPTSTLTKL